MTKIDENSNGFEVDLLCPVSAHQQGHVAREVKKLGSSGPTLVQNSFDFFVVDLVEDAVELSDGQEGSGRLQTDDTVPVAC
jgi:hypothetical protein